MRYISSDNASDLQHLHHEILFCNFTIYSASLIQFYTPFLLYHIHGPVVSEQLEVLSYQVYYLMEQTKIQLQIPKVLFQ